MGDLMGGSESKSESKNLAYPWIKQNYGGPGADAYGTGVGGLMGILSGNSAESQGAVDNFWKSTGGDFLLDKGMDDITAKMAKLGLTHSGAAMKGFEDYRQGLASTKLNDLMQNFLGLGQLGLGGGNLVANAGQVSKGSQSGSSGLGGLLGPLLSAALL